jgi:hypothetical protein
LFDQHPPIEYLGIQVRDRLSTLLVNLTYWVFNGKVIRDLELQKRSPKGPFTLDQLMDSLLKKVRQHLKSMLTYRLSWGTFENFIVFNWIYI